MSSASPNTTDEWPREKKKSDGKWPLPVVHQLAGGVVDRGDVVGVECVA